MDLKIAMEWDEQCGISLTALYPFVDGIEENAKRKNYGCDVKYVWIVLICRARDLKQRKRFKSTIHRLEYDIILDYYLIKNVEIEEKKNIICKQVIDVTTQIFLKYRFKNFDKATFLRELEVTVNSVIW